MEVNEAIAEMLAIVAKLRERHPHRCFTLDGRLVGDFGEVLAEREYDLRLTDKMEHHHDGTTPDGRRVQVKATMQESLTFPADHIPDYYLGLKIHTDGTPEEVFNGPGHIIGAAIAHRKKPKNNLHSVSLNILKRLTATVTPADRIPNRTPTNP